MRRDPDQLYRNLHQVIARETVRGMLASDPNWNRMAPLYDRLDRAVMGWAEDGDRSPVRAALALVIAEMRAIAAEFTLDTGGTDVRQAA